MTKHIKKYETSDFSMRDVLKQNPFLEDINEDEDDMNNLVGQSLPVHSQMLKQIYEHDDSELYASAEDELPKMNLVNRITRMDNDYAISIYQKRELPEQVQTTNLLA